MTGQAKDPLRSAFSLFIKELIWRYAIRFEPSKRPICLYASRRSGSTLLMEVICANRGVMFSDQPFSAYTASSANLNLLPVFPYGQVAFPDAEEEAILRHYFEGLLSGRVRANIPWKFWGSGAHLRNDRLCLKITDAKTMIEWFDTHFDVHTVVLTRHPIAQALSVSRLGWLATGKGLLRNAGYVERWLSTELEAFCWDVYRQREELERRVLDWALENLPMLSLLRENRHWLYVSYEGLVARTEQTVDYLANELELGDRRKMIARVGKPSRSVRRESAPDRKDAIRQGDRESLLSSWQSKLAADQVRACFRVLDRFGIDLYRPDSSFPDLSCIGRHEESPKVP